MTEQTGKIAEALAAFQSEMPTVAKSQRADVPTKTGGKFSYTYAGLPDISEAVMPVLTKHGLAFSCLPRLAERGYELVGWLLHTSGESLEGALPIHGTTPQEMGSAITYARRYLFGCMTGVVTDDDDDGALAQQSKRAPAQRTAPAGVDAVTGEITEARSSDLLTPKQLGKIGLEMANVGITDHDEAIRFCRWLLKDDAIQSRKDLTKKQAGLVIDKLLSMPAREAAPPLTADAAPPLDAAEPDPDPGPRDPWGGT